MDAAIEAVDVQLELLDRAAALEPEGFDRAFARVQALRARGLFLGRAERVAEGQASSLEALEDVRALLERAPGHVAASVLLGEICYDLADHVLHGAETDGPPAEAALGWLRECERTFEDLEARGALLPSQVGYLPRIRGRMVELRSTPTEQAGGS